MGQRLHTTGFTALSSSGMQIPPLWDEVNRYWIWELWAQYTTLEADHTVGLIADLATLVSYWF